MLLLPLRSRGFTLVELLVVISIIAILMGLLIPAISLVKERAKQAKARTQLAQIEAALKIFKDVNGLYPEESRTSPVVPMTSNAQTNATLLRTALETVDREHYTATDSLKDPWKNDLRYRPARFLPFTAGSLLLLDSDNPPGGDSYQLWSIGKNGRDDASVIPTADPKKVGDDLVTWK